MTSHAENYLKGLGLLTTGFTSKGTEEVRTAQSDDVHHSGVNGRELLLFAIVILQSDVSRLGTVLSTRKERRYA